MLTLNMLNELSFIIIFHYVYIYKTSMNIKYIDILWELCYLFLEQMIVLFLWIVVSTSLLTGLLETKNNENKTLIA